MIIPRVHQCSAAPAVRQGLAGYAGAALHLTMVQHKWHRVTDVKAFLASQGRVVRGEHAFKTLKRITWPVCTHCGLMLLRNDATRRAAKAPCERID